MTRQTDLPFNFDRGSCNTFKLPEEKVLMCFSADGWNLSRARICHM